MEYLIPLSYNPIDSSRLIDLLDGHKELHHNEFISAFERAIADITGAKYVVALNSGTAAIHLGLKALGVGRDDEVLVSTFTYIASVSPVLYLGARPVFVDSENLTWNMDPELLELAIKSRLDEGSKPKAIIVVHAYGMPAQLDRLMNISQKYDIPILEDAAEALGSLYKGRQLGTIGKVGIVSFNNNKIITTYGGGVLMTEDSDLYEKVVLWASQARESKLYYEHKEEGYSYRIGPVNAAVGLIELPSLQERVEKRRILFDKYQQGLSGLANFLKEPGDMVSNRWLTSLVLKKGWNREVIEAMGRKRIEARFLWNPMHLQPLFAQCKSFLSGNSEHLFNFGLALPSGRNLSSIDLEKVIDVFGEEFS